jgi:bacillithiol synthase
MQNNCTIDYIAHKDTNCFSQIVLDYLQNKPDLQQFYNLYPDLQNIEKAIAQKQNQSINRIQLVSGLQQQYTGMEMPNIVEENIQKLLLPTTFTICTAHQPNIFTGPLYFVFKILHTVVLCNYLANKYQNYHFVPVYYMGAEDADINEIGTFHIGNKRFQWQPPQAGAVGRINTESLQEVLAEVAKYIDVNTENGKHLYNILTDAYNQKLPLAAATIRLVHHLFGQYGVVVLQPDAAVFKQLFVPIMQQELLHQSSNKAIQETNTALAKQYKPQAFSRPINLFYLQENSRDRIEFVDGKYQVVNSDLQFTEAEILEILHHNPERFSPNVILRGLLQETLLPNIAFVGGGGELAYWLQLKNVFAQHSVVFPMLILRQSMQIINPKTVALQQQLNITNTQLYLPLHQLQQQWIVHNFDLQQFDNQKKLHQQLFDSYQKCIENLPKSFSKTIIAHQTKSIAIQHRLQTKLIAAYKKKDQISAQKIETLHQHIFPNRTLQERHDNFIPYYLAHGNHLFTIIQQAILPFGQQFALLKIAE